MRRFLHLLILVAGAATLAVVGGCSAAPPATRYLFPMPEAPAPRRTAGDDSVPAVRLAQVRVPSYLGAAVIPHLRADGSLGTSPAQQWAEDPQQAITRTLGSALRAASGATVIHEPWPLGLESTRSLAVSIHRLLGTPGGETRLLGQFQYLGPDRVLRVRDFDLREAVPGNDTRALLRSYAGALTSLAELLAEELRTP